MRSGDTIVALSSGSVPAGVAVVRLSGPSVPEILTTLVGELPRPRVLTLRAIGGETLIDRGLVAFFPAPHSFTGEDCAEFQVHGSAAVVKALLARIQDLGARLAEAGEFTRRAFENGKLDLIAVDGLGDLLSAETELQRQQALSRYDGRLTEQVLDWRDRILMLRAEIEARLDFSDEGDVDDMLPETFAVTLNSLHSELRVALGSITGGRLIREGIRVALAGPPNVGKSSLINALSRSDVAIVSPEAGTTRDVREVPLDIGGQLFLLLDLAGLRETTSLAEREGIRRARQAMESADIVLWLTAPDVPDAIPDLTTGRLVRVATKSDLGQPQTTADIVVSARDGRGIEDLLGYLRRITGDLVGGEPGLISHERDRMALVAAIDAIGAVGDVLGRPELAAERLRQASASLERLIGRIDAEQVLDQLFLRFCIGK